MRKNGFSLLEILFSLSIGLFLIALMIKLFSLQESLHKDIVQLSTLNRHALVVRQIFTHEIESAKNVEILDQGRQIKIDNNIFYIQKNNLYVKNINKDKDVAVALLSDVKDIFFKSELSVVTISATVFIPENCNDQKTQQPGLQEKYEKPGEKLRSREKAKPGEGVCSSDRITLHFSVKSHAAVES